MNDPFLKLKDDYSAELVRKAIHLCSLSIPIIYYYITRKTALEILIPVTIAFVLADIARYYHHPTRELFYKIFGNILRKHETDEKKKRLNGASYVLIAATICVLFFPKIITITCFTILIVGDSMAALVGKRYGKHKFFDKSLEGSLGFFLSGLIVITVSPKVENYLGEYLIGIVALIVGTCVEALKIELDDNLSIPLTVGTVLWLMYWLFLPKLNIYILG